MNFVEKIFGTHSDRELKYIYPIIDKIEKLRPTMQAMSDDELKDQTRKFKERLACRRNARRYSAGGICNCQRGSKESLKYGALPGTAHRWYRPSSGTYRRDEDR